MITRQQKAVFAVRQHTDLQSVGRSVKVAYATTFLPTIENGYVYARYEQKNQHYRKA
ncbi:hypothetical protein ES707_14778 [subsurface metagenome]